MAKALEWELKRDLAAVVIRLAAIGPGDCAGDRKGVAEEERSW